MSQPSEKQVQSESEKIVEVLVSLQSEGYEAQFDDEEKMFNIYKKLEKYLEFQLEVSCIN